MLIRRVLAVAVLGAGGWTSAPAAWLGVSLQAQPADLAGGGATVAVVAARSPAEKAGLRTGDVVVGVQGRTLRRPEELVQLARNTPPGQVFRLEVLRGGQPLAMTAELVTEPGNSQAAIVKTSGQPAARRSGLAGLGLPAGGVPLSLKRTPHCSAQVPANWAFFSNPQASAAESQSADRRTYAGWGVTAINRAMQQFYGPLYGDPETSIAFLANQVLSNNFGDRSGLRYTGNPQTFLNYFTLRHFESARVRGIVFYRIYPGDMPQNYVESVYFAMADKVLGSAGLAQATGVAVSIRCQTQFVQRRDPGDGKGGGAACGGEGNLRGYNKELGWQYAHSPSTGENYLLDAATQWQENGPQGAGYYRKAGNGYEKLEPGRSDDC